MATLRLFEETPTAEHWYVPRATEPLRYEHIQAAAGERADDHRLETDIRALKERRGAEYYGDLLFALTHRRYSPEAAERLWRRVLDHRDRLTAQLGRNPGVVVSALDYLCNIEGALVRPTLIEELKLSRLVDSATHDGLTGLFDRSTLRLTLTRALRGDPTEPVSVIMIDLDHFKQFNDRYGHVEGDQALKRVADIMQRSVRDTDICARYGGEEFCVVMPGRGLEDSAAVAERLRSSIEHELRAWRMTASLGVAAFPEHGHAPLALIAAADAALYDAKRAGRNRVVVQSKLE